MKKIKNSTLIKIGIVLALICSYLFISPIRTTINRIVFLFSMLDVDVIKEYILSFGIWAPVISFFLMIFQAIAAPLPAFLITFANAGLFGWVWGALLSWASAMAGAALCFYIARFFGRGAVEKLTGKFALDSVDGFFEKYGNNTILITRLLPFVSVDLVSYAAGLTSMSFWSFFWATGLGQLPATLVYSYVGGMLTGGAKKFIMGLFILFALSVFIFLFKKVWDDKQKKKGVKSEDN